MIKLELKVPPALQKIVQSDLETRIEYFPLYLNVS